MSAAKRIRETFQKEYSGKDKEWREHYRQKLIGWRKSAAFERVDKPTNPVRARQLGYKAKQGFTVVRVRIRRTGRIKPKIRMGRKPAKSGMKQIKLGQSHQAIAEQRVSRKYPNLEVLNSYWVGEDGMYKFFEVIMVDPNHPVIMNDENINWILNQKRRVFRGLTSSGKKHKKK